MSFHQISQATQILRPIIITNTQEWDQVISGKTLLDMRASILRDGIHLHEVVFLVRS